MACDEVFYRQYLSGDDAGLEALMKIRCPLTLYIDGYANGDGQALRCRSLPSDRFTFSSHGYDLHIENELVADAFAGLSVQEQSILILHFVLDLPDQEVGRLVGMSRSAVQRRRAKSLTELRIKLATLMPKGG